ncbi:MAG: hypothetical protein WA151_11940 [Desulfatirhabdiaceae bacterium]
MMTAQDIFGMFFDKGKAEALAGKPCKAEESILIDGTMGPRGRAEEEAYRMGYDEGQGLRVKGELEKMKRQRRLF